MRRAIGGAAGLALALAVVVLVEVAIARSGDRLPEVDFKLDGRVGDATSRELRVVWLGDSTAAGLGASSAGAALPRLVVEGLDRAVDLSVRAVSGATIGDVVDQQLPGVARLDPDVVYVSVGANDTTRLTSRADFRRNYRRLLTGLPEKAGVVLLGVPDMGAIPRLPQPLRAIAGLRGALVDTVVEGVAEEYGAAYVDLASETGPAFRGDPERFFAADEYHPSDAGYRLWAAAVLDVARSPSGVGAPEPWVQ